MSIAKKLTLLITFILVIAIAIATTLNIWATQSDFNQKAKKQVDDSNSQTLRILSVTDTLMLERVKSSMATLKEAGMALGMPSLGERTSVKGKSVPELLLGSTKQVNHFDLVDNLTEKMGGTATLFVKAGSEYVRVSTNVMKADGRAIGTILAPSGNAIKKINQNQAYYGKVDILGTPYLTGYEPMHDAQGNTVGIWYVGYKADLNVLNTFLQDSRVMDQGFTALIDDKNRIRSFSNNVTQSDVESALAGDSHWDIQESSFTPWNYRVISAINTDELASKVRQEAFSVILFGIAELVIISLIVAFVINRSITTPLKRITERLASITQGDGDLTLRFNMSGNHELSRLTQGFDHLLDQLCSTVNEIKSISSQLDSSCGQLASIAKESNQEMTMQSDRTGGIVDSVSQISYSLNEVTSQIHSVSDIANQANTFADSAVQQLNTSIKSIENQSHSLENAVGVIDELNQASESISNILLVIQGIAEQTNLLALNAAIEAARAGEQGRGFAVVADEVRSLASRTQESTEEIKKMIDRLLSGAASAKKSMDENSTSARNNVEEISTMFNALEQIMSAVSQMDSLSSAISTSAQQHVQSVSQINDDMQAISTSSQNVKTKANETSNQGQQLESIAKNLCQTVARYRT